MGPYRIRLLEHPCRRAKQHAATSALYPIMEGNAINILHDDAGTSIELDEIIEFGNVRMVQPGLDARFVDEALGQTWSRFGTRENLDCNDAPDPGMYRAVHFAHAPGTKRFEQTIFADRCVGEHGMGRRHRRQNYWSTALTSISSLANLMGTAKVMVGLPA